MTGVELGLVSAVGALLAGFTIYTAAKRPGAGRYLCDDCKFNNDQDCVKAERPKANVCLSYRTATVKDKT